MRYGRHVQPARDTAGNPRHCQAGRPADTIEETSSNDRICIQRSMEHRTI